MSTPRIRSRLPLTASDRSNCTQNYTQNIDTLESIAGITRVLQCHGSFKTATCLQCRIKVPGIEIEREILDQRVPYCEVCLKAHKAEAQKSKPARKKGKKRKEWDDDSDEGDDLLGVMKVSFQTPSEKKCPDPHSLTLRSSGRNLRTTSIKRCWMTETRLIFC